MEMFSQIFIYFIGDIVSCLSVFPVTRAQTSGYCVIILFTYEVQSLKIQLNARSPMFQYVPFGATLNSDISYFQIKQIKQQNL